MSKPTPPDLPVIQKTYDLVKWYVPVLNRLPRDHRFTLGERIINGLYDLLEGLILARYSQNKLEILENSTPASICCATKPTSCSTSASWKPSATNVSAN